MMIVSTVVAQTQEQERIILFNTENNNSPFIINPNSFFEKELTLEKKDYPIRRVLRIAGGSILPNKFALRGETNFRKQEFLIDDNLDSLIRSKDKYSLYFKGENYQYEQHAYNRITSLELSKGTLDLDFRYKTKHLKVEERGDFGIELQLYYKKEGRNKDDIYDKPDSIGHSFINV